MLYFLACFIFPIIDDVATDQSKDNNDYTYFGNEYNNCMKKMMKNLSLAATVPKKNINKKSIDR